jgi:hypothetical protein
MKCTSESKESLEIPKEEISSNSTYISSKYLYESNDIEIFIIDNEINNKEYMILYIYEVDEALNIIHEYNGILPISLEYNHEFRIAGDLNISVLDLYGEYLDIKLSYTFSPYDEKERLSLHTLPSKKQLNTNGKLTLIDRNIKQIKSFQISINKARNLIPDSYGSADTFCEIYYNDIMVYKTNVIKNTLYPEWNQSFNIVYRGLYN